MNISTATPTTMPIEGPDTPSGERIRRNELSDIYERGTLVLIGCGAAKRNPTDEADLRVASVGPDESFGPDWTDETGPAWTARDLYTSTYFRLKRQFAERIAGCDGGRPGSSPWGVLSAEHHILMPWEDVHLTPS